MPVISILLFGLAGLLLATAVAAIYARERTDWSRWWRRYDHGRSPGASLDCVSLMAPENRTRRHGVGSAEIATTIRPFTAPDRDSSDRGAADVREVYRYTIRRPQSAVRRLMPDLGGFSEVPLRLYDQAGNRFTVHQKVRLN